MCERERGVGNWDGRGDAISESPADVTISATVMSRRPSIYLDQSKGGKLPRQIPVLSVNMPTRELFKHVQLV